MWVVPLEKALYGHPDSGMYWEKSVKMQSSHWVSSEWVTAANGGIVTIMKGRMYS